MKKVIYDITSIADAELLSSNRTGIYFCAVNVFKEFIKSDDLQLYAYCDMTSMCFAENILCKMAPGQVISIINQNAATLYLSKIWVCLEKKRIIHKKNGNKYRNYFLCSIELLIKALSNMFQRKNIAENFDAYFSPAKQAPKYILKNPAIKKYIILHDAIAFIYPEYFPGMSQKWRHHWAKTLLGTMSNEELFFANSMCTKKDFLKLKDLDPERIIVNYHACSSYFKTCFNCQKIEAIKRKYGIDITKKYIFSLCTIEPRKNLVRIVKTFIEFINQNEINDLVLVLGGSAWNSFIAEFEKQIGNLSKFDQYVKRIGYIEDDDLPILYSGAEWFVYTSQYEGFGVPPLEAMSCGCPVIVSNNSSLPEVVGDAGLLIRWDSDSDHINAYESYYFNSELRNFYSKKGIERAKIFNWKYTSDKIISMIVNES